jgi:hypothetical protein
MLLRLLALTFCALLATAAPAAAAETSSSALLAGYWAGFVEHWTEVFQKQNGIVMGTLLVGAVCLFIITRGKWRK